jgi:hypothetical protein
MRIDEDCSIRHGHDYVIGPDCEVTNRSKVADSRVIGSSKVVASQLSKESSVHDSYLDNSDIENTILRKKSCVTDSLLFYGWVNGSNVRDCISKNATFHFSSAEGLRGDDYVFLNSTACCKPQEVFEALLSQRRGLQRGEADGTVISFNGEVICGSNKHTSQNTTPGSWGDSSLRGELRG